MTIDLARMTWPDGRWAIMRDDGTWSGDSHYSRTLCGMVIDFECRVPGIPGQLDFARHVAEQVGAQCEVLFKDSSPDDRDMIY